jgi:hypothetical protein
MADNAINIQLIIDDKGSLKQATSGVKVYTSAIEKASNAQNSHNKTKNNYSKQEKGVAGLTSNSTKAFAKQAQTLGGTLVPAYASLAANIFALSAGFHALSRAAEVTQLAEGLSYVGRAAGANLPYVAEQLKEISGYGISTAQAMESVALGISSGFSTGQLEDLTKVAKGASVALGRDMGDAMDRLVRGATKLEPEILDELGIMVRLDDATESYAQTLGKTAGDLSQFERRMAFTNAIIEQGTDKFSSISKEIEISPFAKLAASFDDLTKSFLELINRGLSPLISLLSGNQGALIGAITVLGASVTRQMVPGLYKAAEASEEAAAALSKTSQESLKALEITKVLPEGFRRLSDEFKDGVISEEQYVKGLRSLDKSIATYTRTLAEQEKVQTRSNESIAKSKENLREVERARTVYVQSYTHSQKAQIKGIEIAALENAQRLSLRGTIRSVSAAIDANTARIYANAAAQNLSIGIMGRVKIVWYAATVSVKAFGTALLSAMPLIGLAISAGSALYSAFKWLTKPDKLTKTASEIVDSFKDIDEAASQLQDKLNTLAEGSVDRYIATLNTQVGILNQITSGISKIVEAEREQDLEATVEQREKLLKYAEHLTTQEIEILKKGGDDAQDIINKHTKLFGSNWAFLYAQQLAEIRKETKNLEAYSTSAITAIRKVIDSAIISVESSSSALATALKGDITALRSISEALEDPLISDENKKLLVEYALALNRDLVAAKGNLDSLAESAENYGYSIESALDIDKAPFQETISNLESIVNSFKDVSEEHERALVSKLSDNLKSAAKELSENGDMYEGLSALLALWKSTSEATAESGYQVKIYKNQLKDLKKSMEYDVSSIGEYFSIQDKMLLEQRSLVDSKLKILRLEEASEDTARKIKELVAERSEISRKLSDNSDKLLAKEKALLNIRQLQLGAEDKLASATRERLNALLEYRLSAATIDAGGTGLAVYQELDVFREIKEERIATITQEAKIKKGMIDAEYDLLAHKFKLLNIEANGTLDTSYLDTLESAREAQTRALDLQTKTAINNLEIEERKLVGEYEDTVTKITDSLDGLDSSISTALSSSLDSIGASNDLTSAIVDSIKKTKELDSIAKKVKENLKPGTPEYESAMSKIETTRQGIRDPEEMRATIKGSAPDEDTLFQGQALFKSVDEQPQIIAMKEQHARQLQLLEEYGASRAEMEMVQQEQALERERLYAEQSEALFNARTSAVGSFAGSMAASIKSIMDAGLIENRKAWEAYKAFAIVEATVSTYNSATKAFSSMASIPYVGPALGAAAAAAAIASGMAQVAAIKQQQPAYAEGGEIQGLKRGRKADNVTIAATPGEYMMSRDTVDYYGSDFMNKLNNRQLSVSEQKYAVGGLIRGSSTTQNVTNTNIKNISEYPENKESTKKEPTSGSPNIINVLDPSIVSDYISTADGENAIVNIVRRNKGAI